MGLLVVAGGVVVVAVKVVTVNMAAEVVVAQHLVAEAPEAGQQHILRFALLGVIALLLLLRKMVSPLWWRQAAQEALVQIAGEMVETEVVWALQGKTGRVLTQALEERRAWRLFPSEEVRLGLLLIIMAADRYSVLFNNYRDRFFYS